MTTKNKLLIYFTALNIIAINVFSADLSSNKATFNKTYLSKRLTSLIEKYPGLTKKLSDLQSKLLGSRNKKIAWGAAAVIASLLLYYWKKKLSQGDARSREVIDVKNVALGENEPEKIDLDKLSEDNIKALSEEKLREVDNQDWFVKNVALFTDKQLEIIFKIHGDIFKKITDQGFSGKWKVIKKSVKNYFFDQALKRYKILDAQKQQEIQLYKSMSDMTIKDLRRIKNDDYFSLNLMKIILKIYWKDDAFLKGIFSQERSTMTGGDCIDTNKDYEVEYKGQDECKIISNFFMTLDGNDIIMLKNLNVSIFENAARLNPDWINRLECIPSKIMKVFDQYQFEAMGLKAMETIAKLPQFGDFDITQKVVFGGVLQRLQKGQKGVDLP